MSFMLAFESLGARSSAARRALAMARRKPALVCCFADYGLNRGGGLHGRDEHGESSDHLQLQ